MVIRLKKIALYPYVFVVLSMIVVPPWSWEDERLSERWKFSSTGKAEVAYVAASFMTKPGVDASPEDVKVLVEVMRMVAKPIEVLATLTLRIGGDLPPSAVFVKYSPIFYRPYMARVDLVNETIAPVEFDGIHWPRLILQFLVATGALLITPWVGPWVTRLFGALLGLVKRSRVRVSLD